MPIGLSMSKWACLNRQSIPLTAAWSNGLFIVFDGMCSSNVINHQKLREKYQPTCGVLGTRVSPCMTSKNLEELIH